MLLFFPGALTSVCTTELNTVNNERSEFGSDVHIAGISTDSSFVLQEYSAVLGDAGQLPPLAVIKPYLPNNNPLLQIVFPKPNSQSYEGLVSAMQSALPRHRA